jgi:hypothetical protein
MKASGARLKVGGLSRLGVDHTGVKRLSVVIVVLAVPTALGIAFYRFADLEVVAVVIHQLFLPTMVLALALSAAWRFLPVGSWRTSFQIVGTAFFFAPLVAVAALWHQSVLLVLHQEATATLGTLAVAGALGWRALGGAKRGTSRAAVMLAFTLAVGGYGAWCASLFIRDAFLPRVAVQGSVDRLWESTGPRRIAVHRYLSVNGQTYEATYDVFRRLRTGDRINAEAGAGSNVLLRIR